MAYTPELSMQSSRTLRRISWALGVPMTKAIEYIFEHLPKYLDSQKVCKACKDPSRCSTCAFNYPKKGGDGSV